MDNNQNKRGLNANTGESAYTDNSRTAYILDAYSTDLKNSSGQVNVLTLCCLDDKGYFEVELHNKRLVFFIIRNTEIPGLRGMTRRPVNLTDFHENKLDGLYFKSLSAYFEGAKRLREAGIKCLESDVHPDERFLMEHFIFRGLSIPTNRKASNRGLPFPVYNPETIEPAEYSPDFKITSFDIETGRDGTLYIAPVFIHGTATVKAAQSSCLIIIKLKQEVTVKPP